MPWLAKILANIVAVLVLGTVICVAVMGVGFGAFKLSCVHGLVMKVLAMIVGILVLSVKMLGVLVHTENVKMINVRATSYEGIYEASFQLFLIMHVWLVGLTDLDGQAMASSILMIAKAGAENFLTFGEENKIADRNILGKLKQIVKLLPAFLFTALFRITTLSLCYAWDYYIFLVLLLSALFLPLVVLLLLKMCGKLPHLSGADLVQGSVGEVTTIVLWGDAGREGSRRIQAMVGGYILMLYSAGLALVSTFPSGFDRCLLWGCYTSHSDVVTGAVLTSGVIGYALCVYQLFLFGHYNWDWRKKIHNLGSLMAGH